MISPYLSPARFLVSGYGIDTSAMTAVGLRNTLQRATAAVNSFCNSPQLPQAHDFRGGTITDEQHIWPTVDVITANNLPRRVFLNHRPVRDITSFRISLGSTYSVVLNPPTDLYVNRLLGYVEIVALAPTVIGFWPAGYPFGLWQPVAEVSYTYDYSYEIVGDVLEADSPTLFYASHGSWYDDPDTIAVYIDGVAVDTADYTFNVGDGSVTFTEDAAPPPDQVATVDYTTLIPDAIEQATGLLATHMIGESRIAARGMIGLSSIKVAEITLTQMQPSQMVTRNGVSIPVPAAQLLGPYVIGSSA